MFEFDKYQKTLHRDAPAQPESAYEPVSGVAEMSLLMWSEHCVECAAPTCYQTCDLYQARPDGRCRRFAFGAHKNPRFSSLRGHGVEVSFKKWAKLEAYGNTALRPVESIRWRERLIEWIAPVSNFFGRIMNKLTRDWRWNQLTFILSERLSRYLHASDATGAKPDGFLLEVYNPTPKTVRMHLTMRLAQGDSHNKADLVRLTPSFVTTVVLPSGYSCHRLERRLFQSITEAGQPFQISLVPEGDENARLVFLTADFVKYAAKPVVQGEAKKIKCVVWDVDNTLWQGILVEGDEVVLRPQVAELLRYFDERGILLSIASKNDHSSVWDKLTEMGIAEYFVYPQINWMPKSQNIKVIAERLNIGLDTFAFVDDNPFELEEVSRSLPEVVCINALEIGSLPGDARFQGAVTAESRQRRRYYQEAIVREKAQEEFGFDYFGFLGSCGITLEIASYAPADLERVAELVQRTNQLNFSGRKYTRTELNEILENRELEKYVLRCTDKYGSYGTVGFCIVHHRKGAVEVQDFMLSCRVQGKFLEQAFFSHLLEDHNAHAAPTLWVNFHETARNKPAQQVLESLHFRKCDPELGEPAKGMVLTPSNPLACDFIHVACSSTHPGADAASPDSAANSHPAPVAAVRSKN